MRWKNECGGKRPFCPQFIKFSQGMGWERPFCPQFIKFSQVVGWERPFLIVNWE
ncbi:MAG: hypothetical protein IPH82_26655 [Chloroflexi bacterium]|nr:hypothetical protein [Chloroflexota bacterium]